jgi:succinoglycan biosynthesis transport protein ExoP
MNEHEDKAPGPGLKLADIYFVLFRHLRLVLFFAGAGLLAAVVLYAIRQPLYQSEAKLMVLYVLDDAKTFSSVAGASEVKSLDTRGETIIGAEKEILSSWDLAEQVADTVGPERLLRALGGGTNRLEAAAQIVKNLEVEVLNKANVLKVTYRHPEKGLVQPVLGQLIESYLKKNLDTHRLSGKFDEYFRKQADQFKAQLHQTEEDLRKLKSQNNVVSVEDSKKALSDRMLKIRNEIWEAEKELADRRIAAPESEKNLPKTNNVPASLAEVPAEKVNDYRSLVAVLESVKTQEQALINLHQFTPENPTLMQLRAKKANLLKNKQQMEQDAPQLAELEIRAPAAAGQPADAATEARSVATLERHLKGLNAQLESIQNEAIKLDSLETAIQQLQRSRELQETNYRHFAIHLDQARNDGEIGAGMVSNISTVQAPSFPLKAPGKTKKLVLMVLAGGLFGGLGLAFLIEMYLDQTIKRPEEVESKLRLPLLVSFPFVGNGPVRIRLPGLKWLASRKSSAALSVPEVSGGPAISLPQPTSSGTTSAPAGAVSVSMPTLPGEAQQGLNLYFAALRDRLTTYFEVRNMTRKPKLVAITSCGNGAGVSTVASGLAAILSETGDSRVLLVDMDAGHTAVHPFHNGKPACGLAEVLEPEKREPALVQENLYMVNVNGHDTDANFPQILPKRFLTLMPKFKASDYDFILFDMPPISQTSATPRLAGLTDMVLLVLEAEKTQQEAAKRAHALLREAKANVAVILNKRRTYVPHAIHQEI